jgi:TonB-dependent SusC/RagA subfamily outer membrane receptor
MTKNLRLLSLLFLLTCQVMAFGQTRTVTGKVTDDTNAPLPGVSIVIEGTTTGAITNIDGNYSIELTAGQDILLFSFIGFDNQRVNVAGKTVVNIALQPSNVALDMVVVVGYGTSKRSDLTGAIASISEEKIKASVVANFDQALQGRVAGVQVTQNSGQPGGASSIRIRGASSINGSNEPLYVIDGIPFQGSGAATIGFDWAGGANGQNRVNPLSTINPSDIVSIDVLKDASASAIYGTQAANGVVLVTTRRGKEGE